MYFRDLKEQYIALKDDIDSGIASVIENSDYILGNKVKELEKRLAEYVERKYCISCGNGTDALQLSLMALNIHKNDAVFTSDFTFFASAGTTSILGGTPVFVDINPHTFNICPIALEEQIKRVIKEGKLIPRVILTVDLFGQPADYNQIIPIAEKYGLTILEDAAQGFGGSINGKKACSFGTISTTSFYPAKPLGCYGDGGAIFVDDDNLHERLMSLRSQGRSPIDKYDNCEIGINSRLDTIQAAILIPKLKAFIEYELDSVNRVASLYSDLLSCFCETPIVNDGFISSWAQYTIKLKNRNQRDGLKEYLSNFNIPSVIYYPRGIHQQKAYNYMNLDDDLFPNTIDVVNRVLSLPIHPYLKDEEVYQITNKVIEYLRGTEDV